jgi:hypothetical protein
VTRKLLVRQGGFTAAEVDFINDFAARKGAPWLDGSSAPLIQMAHRFANGESAQGYFKITDPDALLSTAGFRLRPWAEVRLTEDASGSELTLAWMRVTANDASRLTSTIAGDEVEHDPQLMDINLDLRGIPWRDGWERPAETDWDRLDALEAAKLNGSASTAPIHRNSTDITIARTINGHLVNVEGGETDLDANDYPAGTEQYEIISDVATQSGKIFGVVLHHDGGTHKCLLYIDQDDLTTYTTGVRISDDPADWDPSDPTTPTFEPHWRMGAAREQNMEDVASGIISIYAGLDNDPRTVFVQTGDPDDEWETWIAVYHDDLANQHLAQATRRANWILADRRLPYQTHQVSILVDAEQAHLVEAGMAIQTKSVAMEPGPNRHAWIWRRVAEKAIEPEADGRYWLHLHLERPHHTHGAGGGAGQPAVTTPKPPTPGTPGTATTATGAGIGSNGETQGPTVAGGTGQLIAVLVTGAGATPDPPAPVYRPDTAASDEPLTIIGNITHPAGGTTHAGNQLWVARLENPTASGSVPVIDWGNAAGGVFGSLKGYWTSPSTTTPVVTTAAGTGVTASVTPTGAGAADMVLMCAGARIHSFGDAGRTPVDGSSQDDDWAVDFNAGAGQYDGTWYGGHLAGSGTRSVSMVDSVNWVAAAIAIPGTGGTAGDETEPIGPTGSGDPGDSPIFSPINHIHEHGLLSADELHYHDTSQIEGIDELGGGATTAIVTDHGSMGATEDFDFTLGSDHEGTQDDDLTVTLTGAIDGEPAFLTLKLAQDVTGGRTIDLPAEVVNAADLEAAWDVASEAVNVLTLFTYDGGASWYGALMGDEGITDHGALTGLADDDHTQYLKETDVAAKGDVYAASANDTVGVLTVGTNGQVLTAASGETLGVKWADAASAGTAVGAILIQDTPAGSPLVFADLLQNEAGTDLLYEDV